MDLTVRPITASEVGTFRAKMARGFGTDPYEEDDGSHILKTLDLERTVCAFDGDELIGTSAAFTFDVTVPGGALPMGGTTMVTVQATHRRRGVMTAMMQAHLEEVRGRGEPLAGLWASEASIYGRFGYGLAAEAYELSVDGRMIEFCGDPPDGRVTLIEPDEARRTFPAVYDRVRPTRSGMLTRSEPWWDGRVFYDPKHRRRGRSAQRYATYVSAQGTDGYAIYRQKEKWDDFPEGVVHVVEIMAATPQAHEGLWRYLTSIDLFPMVKYDTAPVDDELPWRITEHRRIRRVIGDSLWVRLLDIPRALAGRSYRPQGCLVLGIRDPFLPDNDGAYRLETGPGGAQCHRTDTTPDIELSVDTLGALYLGAHRISTLARSGLVRGSNDTLAAADRLFGWDVLPWCPENF